MVDLSEFEAAARRLRDQDAADQASATISNAATVNPDQAAKHLTLARRFDVPVSSVAADPIDLERYAKLLDADTAKLAQQSPVLARHLADQNVANVMHDDIPNASRLEQEITNWNPSFGERAIKALHGMFGIDGREGSWLHDAMARTGAVNTGAGTNISLTHPTAQPTQIMGDKLAAQSEVPEQFIGNTIEGVTFGLIPKGVPEAHTSAGQVAAMSGGLAGFLVGPVKGAGFLLGASKVAKPLEHVAGESFAKAMAKDVAHQAAVLGLASGLAATGDAINSPDLGTAAEKVGTATLHGAEMGATFGAAGRLLPDTTFMQGIVRALGVNAAMDLEQGKQPFEDAARWNELDDKQKTEALFNYGLNTLFSLKGQGRVSGGWFKDAAEAKAAAETGEKVAAVSQLATTSKWRERDHKSFKDWMANITEEGNGLTAVYVKGDVFAQAMRDNGVTIPELEARMPEVAKQLAGALEAQGDVRVSVADYATHIAGSPLEAAIFPHVKDDPMGKTVAEGQAFYSQQADSLKTEAMNLTTKQAGDKDYDAQVKQVHDDMLAQITATGRANPEAAKADAALYRDAMVALGDRLGVSPKEAHEKYGAGAQRVEVGGEGFNQKPFKGEEVAKTPIKEGTTHVEVDGAQRHALNSNGKPIHPTEEGVRNFWRWFGDSKVVDAEGRPVVVYHGTSKEFDTFNTEAGVGARHGGGSFFTANPEKANTYAGGGDRNVMPVYLRMSAPVRVQAAGKNWNALGKSTKIELPELREDQQKDEDLLAELEGRAPEKAQPKVLKPRRTTIGKLFPDEFQYGDETFSTNDIVRWSRKMGAEGVVLESVKDHGPAGVFASEKGGEASDVFAVFDPTQIKSATGNTGEFNPLDANILHQKDEPRDLIVQHNLSEENLLHADKMGGLPVPSLAITKKDTPLTGFGEITLLGDEALADPKGYAKTKVYGADIYSPRYPQITHSVEFKAVRKLNDDVLGEYQKQTGDGYIDADEIARNGAKAFADSSAVMAKFLDGKGIKPEIVPEEGPKPLGKNLDAFKDDTRSAYDLAQDEAFQKAAIKAHNDLIKRQHAPDPVPKDEVFSKESERFGRTMIAYARDVEAYQRAKRDAGKPNTYRTRGALRKQIDEGKLRDEFNQFTRDTLASLNPVEKIFKGFTNQGNRKYIPHTLDNVIKELKKELRGGEGFNYGVGNVRARFTPEFKSVAQIRKAKDRLLTADKFEEVKRDIDVDLENLADSLRGNHAIGKEYGFLDTLTNTLYDAATMGLPRAFKENGFTDVSESQIKDAAEFLEKLRHLPTEYFEAKILRAVDLSEFKAAVVPDKMGKAALDALARRGITKIVTYKTGDPADRAAKIAEQEHLFFQAKGEVTRGSYNPDTRMIGLLKDANLTTYLHEMGHYLFDIHSKIALDPNAPASIKADVDTLLRYVDVKGDTPEARLASWHSLTVEGQREAHEKMARSFEGYLLEGKAPSLELQPVFARIRAWMVRAYKSLKDLGVELTPEVRAVFNRMLATDKAIEEAQRTRGLAPIFTAKPEGVSDSEWADYTDLGIQATTDAVASMDAKAVRDVRWLRNAHSKVMRGLQREAEEKRREVRIDARREILSQPIYRAWSFLTRKDPAAYQKWQESGGKELDSSFDNLHDAIRKLGGLDAADVEATWGIRADQVPKGVLKKKGGLKIDHMAELLSERGNGYLPVDANGKWDLHDFEDKFVNGENEYSNHAEYDRIFPQEITPGEAAQYPAGKLDAASARALGMPEADIARLEKFGMLSEKNGMPADVVADVFGYESAEGFIRDLARAEPPNSAIEGLTDQYMLERHGELSSPQDIARAADEAVSNEARARFVATGLKMLTKSPISARDLAKAAKEAADSAIAQKKISELSTRMYEAAEARANKEVFKTVAKDPQKAVSAQRASLLNNALVRSTHEAQREVEKAVEHLKQTAKGAAQDNMRGEHLTQYNAILARFDLRTSLSKAEIEKNKQPLGEWMVQRAEELDAVMPELPEFVLNENYRLHYTELSVEEFRGLRDALKQLEFLARREEKMYQAVRNMNFAQESEAILASIRKTTPEIFDEEGRPKNIEPKLAPTMRDAVEKMGEKFAGEMLNAETIISILDGGEIGQVHESLFKRLSDRSNWKTQRMETIMGDMKPVYDAYSFIEKRDFARKDIGTSSPLKMRLTRENAVVVALLHGSKDGRQRLENYGWSESKQRDIIDLLDKRDLDLVKAIWHQFDQKLWPELYDLNMRTRGKAPPKVEGEKYMTKHGEMEGGYFRLKYDTDLDERAHRFDEGAAVKELLGGGMGMSSKTAQGTSTERKQQVAMRPRLDLGVFAEAVNETVHDLAYREAVADTMRLLNHKGVQSAIKQSAGTPAYRALVTRVREIAAPPRNPMGWVEKPISIARKNTVITLMSGVNTALQNITGLVPALVRVDAGLLARELARFYSPSMASVYKFTMEQSEYMRLRGSSFDRDMNNMADKLTVNGKIMPDTATWLKLMSVVDRAVTVPVWNAAFREGLGKFANDHGRAVEYADHIVRQTQGSGREVDLAKIMSGHGGWGQLKGAFTMFYSYFNGMLNMLVRSGVINAKLAGENRTRAVAKFTGDFMAIVVIPAILSELYFHPSANEDEDPTTRFSRSLAMYVSGFFPIGRELSSATWSAFDHNVANYGYKMSPIESAGEGVIKGMVSARDILEGEGDDRDTKNVIMGTSFAVGLPGKLIADTVMGTDAWLNHDAPPQSVIYGPPKK